MVLGKKRLSDFWVTCHQTQSQLEAWICEAEEAQWKTPHDIKKRYSTASLRPGKLVIFNIKGNKYRLLTKVDYKNQIILVLKIGTHEDYEKWIL